MIVDQEVPGSRPGGGTTSHIVEDLLNAGLSRS
jgi:hypothetical protein